MSEQDAPPPRPPGVLGRFVGLVDRGNDAAGRLACWLMLLVVLVGTYNTLARQAGSYFKVALTSNSLNELQWYLFGFIFLLGGAWTLRKDKHVRVDVLYSRLTTRRRRRIDVVGHALFLVPFCVWMIAAAVPRVAKTWQEYGPDPGSLPRGPIKVLVPIAFAILALQGLAEIARILGTPVEEDAA